MTIIVFLKWLILRPSGPDWWKFYQDYLHTGYWRAFSAFRRRSWLARLFGWDKCARCDSRRGLQVHHTTYSILFREWLPWNWRKVQTLCQKCHSAVTAQNRERDNR